MFTADNLRKDTRFYIDERNAQRLLANGNVPRYAVAFVPIGSVIRLLNGELMSLYDTDVYAFLSRTEEGEQRYEEYCRSCNVAFRTKENYLELINEMHKMEYDIKKGAIVIDENNLILDGQHRLCILLDKYGPYHKVEVVKLFFDNKYSKKFRIKLYICKIKTMLRCFLESVKRIKI